jgi:hypothetical protein
MKKTNAGHIVECVGLMGAEYVAHSAGGWMYLMPGHNVAPCGAVVEGAGGTAVSVADCRPGCRRLHHQWWLAGLVLQGQWRATTCNGVAQPWRSGQGDAGADAGGRGAGLAVEVVGAVQFTMFVQGDTTATPTIIKAFPHDFLLEKTLLVIE